MFYRLKLLERFIEGKEIEHPNWKKYENIKYFFLTVIVYTFTKVGKRKEDYINNSNFVKET